MQKLAEAGVTALAKENKKNKKRNKRKNDENHDPQATKKQKTGDGDQVAASLEPGRGALQQSNSNVSPSQEATGEELDIFEQHDADLQTLRRLTRLAQDAPDYFTADMQRAVSKLWTVTQTGKPTRLNQSARPPLRTLARGTKAGHEYIGNSREPLDKSLPFISMLFNFDAMFRHLDRDQARRLECTFDEDEIISTKKTIRMFTRIYRDSLDFVATIHHFVESVSHMSQYELEKWQPELDEEDLAFAKRMLKSFQTTYEDMERDTLAAGASGAQKLLKDTSAVEGSDAPKSLKDTASVRSPDTQFE